MLSLEPQDLYNEIRDAETLRKKHLEIVKDIVSYMVGRKYRIDHENEPVPENYFFAYQAFVLPQLVFERPVVKCTPTKLITDADTADAIELAINQWIKENAVKELLQTVVMDSLIGFGVTKVGLEVSGDHGATGILGDFEMQPSKPFSVRIAPHDFIIDAWATSWRTARLMGHRFERDLDDLQNDPRYDQTKVGDLRLNEPIKPEDSPFELVSARMSRRKTVTLYELYIPEHQKIITLAVNGTTASGDGGGPVILRSEDYYGPKEGPYTLWGLYAVPGQVYPLSPLMALFDQFLELNDHATAAAEEASTYKSFAVVDANDPDLANTVKDVTNGAVIKAKNLNGIKTEEVGGTSKSRIDYIAILRERLDRLMGFADAQRGKADGVTATEAEIADNNSDLRMESMRQKVRDATQNMLRKVGWYFFYEETVIQAVSKVDPVTGQTMQGYVLGGTNWPGQEQQDYVDLAMDIDPYSMVRVDDALLQKRAQDAIQLISSIAPMIPQLPFVNWTKLLDQWGETMNMKKFSETVLNMGMMQQMMGMNPQMIMQGQMMQQMQQQRAPMMAMNFLQPPNLGQNASVMPTLGGTSNQSLMTGAMGRMPSAA